MGFRLGLRLVLGLGLRLEVGRMSHRLRLELRAARVRATARAVLTSRQP